VSGESNRRWVPRGAFPVTSLAALLVLSPICGCASSRSASHSASQQVTTTATAAATGAAGVTAAATGAPSGAAAATGAASSAAAAPAAGAAPLGPKSAAAVVDATRLERLVARKSAPVVSLPESLVANRLATWAPLSVGERVTRWANLFVDRTDNVYCFGPKTGGYVADSLLVQDYKLDCVSLFYRCTELARASTPRDAILLALGTRFAGGDPAHVVRPTGAVDYDDPSHLDYSEDFAATGLWGQDVTREVGQAIKEKPGTSRYPAGSRYYIPKNKIRLDRLRDGDLVLYILDEANDKARKLRQDYGLLVGHQALIDVDGKTVYQIHAAQSDLSGVYTGNRVVRVPLLTYAKRLERFKGIMVLRMKDAEVPAAKRATP